MADQTHPPTEDSVVVARSKIYDYHIQISKSVQNLVSEKQQRSWYRHRCLL